MKKTTRISALILILALLMNLSGAAFATSEGIPIGDLEMSDFEMFTMAALEEEESQEEESVTGDLDDPLGIIGECGEDNIYCGYVKYMLEELTTAQERYDYMMDLYADPEDVVALEMTMAHYYGKAVHRDTNLLCTCNFPSYMPEYQVGIVLDADGNVLVDEDGNEVKHADNCPWNFNKLSTAEQFKLISTDDANLKAQFEEVMSAVTAEKLSRVNAKEYMAEADAVTVQISVPENAFEENENYILTANKTALSEEESAALAAEEATNVLAAFDISFPSLQNEKDKLQPAEAVPLTFTVDVTGVEGESVRVFHIKDDGSVEFVGEPIAIEEGAKSVTIEVAAESFSTWGVDLWYGENGRKEYFYDVTPSYFPAIGFLDNENNNEFVFFTESYKVPNSNTNVHDSLYEKIVSAGDCPDYLVMVGAFTNRDQSKLVYQVSSYDEYLKTSIIDGGFDYISAEAFTEIVPADELYATVPASLNGNLALMSSVYGPSKIVSGSEIVGEYKVEDFWRGYQWCFKLVPDENWPAEAEGYNWIAGTEVVKLSTESAHGSGDQTVVDAKWDSEKNEIVLSYTYPGAAEGVYTWYQLNEKTDAQGNTYAAWEAAEDDIATDKKLFLEVSEEDISALAKVYKCIVTNGNGEIIAISPAMGAVNGEIRSWIANASDGIDVTLEMAKRAFEVGALDKLRVEGTELISVYSGEAIADIVEFLEIEDIRAKLVDRRMGLTVAYVNVWNAVVSVDSVETASVAETDENVEG